ncbi:hypothetical protein ACFL2T_05715 [Elusimicrobiota bacterium]
MDLRIALKVLLAGSLLASAGYSCYQLRRISGLKAALDSGSASSAEVLDQLAASDSSGVIRELISVHRAQIERLRSLPEGDATPVEAAARARSKPATARRRAPPPGKTSGQRLFTASGKVDVFEPGQKPPKAGKGTAVLIDHRTGKHYVVKSGSPGRHPASLSLPSLPEGLKLSLSDDLTSRRRRAYALLIGSAGFALVLVLMAARRFKP